MFKFKLVLTFLLVNLMAYGVPSISDCVYKAKVTSRSKKIVSVKLLKVLENIGNVSCAYKESTAVKIPVEKIKLLNFKLIINKDYNLRVLRYLSVEKKGTLEVLRYYFDN